MKSYYVFSRKKRELEAVFTVSSPVLQSLALLLSHPQQQKLRISGWVEKRDGKATVHLRATGPLSSLELLDDFLYPAFAQPSRAQRVLKLTLEGKRLIEALHEASLPPMPTADYSSGTSETQGSTHAPEAMSATLDYAIGQQVGGIRIALHVPDSVLLAAENAISNLLSIDPETDREGYGPKDVISILWRSIQAREVVASISEVLRGLGIEVAVNEIEPARADEFRLTMQGEWRCAILSIWEGAASALLSIEIYMPVPEVEELVKELLEVAGSHILGSYRLPAAETQARLPAVQLVCILYNYSLDRLLGALNAFLHRKRLKPIEKVFDSKDEAVRLNLRAMEALLQSNIPSTTKRHLEVINRFLRERLW